MTNGQDPVMQSNGLPGHHGVAAGAEPDPLRIDVRSDAKPVRRFRRPQQLPRPRTGMRPSTVALVIVWIAVLGLYLAVRPGG